MKACNYFEKLCNILEKAVITDEKRKKIDFEEGIERIIELILEQHKMGKKVVMAGNGGSTSIAQHGNLDMWNLAGIRTVSFTDSCLLTCMSADYGFDHVFERPIDMLTDAGDVFIAICSSGKSENMVRAVRAAKNKGLKVITLTGFAAANPMRREGQINIHVPAIKYGFIELSHQVIIHMLIDMLTTINNPGLESRTL